MDIREFKNTYKEYAPSLVWDWCAKPTAEEIDVRLMEFADMGISRVYIRPSKGLVLPYLSADYFELIRTAARRGGKYGIKIAICDENSHTSGNGGGEITSVVDYRIRDILKVKKADTEKFDEIISEDGNSALVLRDMSKVRLSDRAPYADISDRFVTECFIDAVYNKYFRECKRFLGMEIEGFLTNIHFPEGFVPCSKSALKKAQISISDELLSDGRKSYTAAFDECISENYTSYLNDECKKNEISLSISVDGDKNFSRQMQYVKADSVSLCVDTENPDFVQIKLAQTVAEQFGKPFFIRLLLPSFAPCSKRYNAASFMSAFGASGIVYDSVAFSLSDRRKYEKHTATISKFSEKAISDRIARQCFVGANTKTDTKVLLVYSPDSDALFNDIAKKLLLTGIPFHMVEEGFFEKLASLGKDFVTIGKNEYTTIITENKMLSFGGNIIFADFDFTPDILIHSDYPILACDKDVFINRRKNENDEYVFVSAPEEDTSVTVEITNKKLFVADSSNGELYRVTTTDGKCHFTVKAGKTAILIYSDELNEDNAPPYTDEIEFTPHMTKCDVPFALASADENILPLKNVNACFGRRSFRENSIDNLHREFYSLNDGESVKVKYPFDADLENIGEVKVFIENADNIEYAELNGHTLDKFEPSAKDPRFMGVDITPYLSSGKNTLALGYKKSNNYNPDFSSFTPSHFYSYNITSFEPVYLCGDFDATEGALIRLDSYENDITKSGMAYYYGPLTYVAKLPDRDLGECVLAILGDFDICRVKIGKRAYTFFSETPMLEIFNLDCGAVAEITIYNTPFNLLRSSKEVAKPFGLEKIEISSFKY